MARFYFDLHECGTVLADEDGVEAQHLETARSLAVAAARDLMASEVNGGALCLSCYIDVRDEANRIVDRVMFRDALTITGLR